MSGRYAIRFARPGFLARALPTIQQAIEYVRRIYRDADGHAEITPSITLTVYDRDNGRIAALLTVVPEHWTPAMVQVLKDRIE